MIQTNNIKGGKETVKSSTKLKIKHLSGSYLKTEYRFSLWTFTADVLIRE